MRILQSLKRKLPPIPIMAGAMLDRKEFFSVSKRRLVKVGEGWVIEPALNPAKNNVYNRILPLCHQPVSISTDGVVLRDADNFPEQINLGQAVSTINDVESNCIQPSSAGSSGAIGHVLLKCLSRT